MWQGGSFPLLLLKYETGLRLKKDNEWRAERENRLVDCRSVQRESIFGLYKQCISSCTSTDSVDVSSTST